MLRLEITNIHGVQGWENALPDRVLKRLPQASWLHSFMFSLVEFETIETLRVSRLNERNVNFIPI